MLNQKRAPLFSRVTLSLILPTLAACAGANSPTGETATASSSRLAVLNQPLSISDGTQSSSSVHAMAVTAPTLTLVATVAPPSVNASPLQANAVAFNGNNIYVSYNLAGAAAGGGIDEIDVTLPAAPVLNSSLQFPTLDVNNVHFLGSSLYVVGNSSVADQPARLQQYTTTLLGAVGTLVSDVPLTGYAGTSLAHDLLGTTLFAATGDNGGIQMVNPSTLALGYYAALPDARDLSVSTAGNLYAVTGNGSGTTGQVAAFNTSGASLGTLSLGNTGAAQSKSTIQTGSYYGLATAGSAGSRLFCLNGLQSVGATPAPTNGVTNAAVFTGGFIFSADGADGVTVYAVNQGLPVVGSVGCNQTTMTRLGTINFGTSVSANGIATYGNYLVVSGGLGGFQLIRLTLPATVTGLVTTL